MRTEDSPVVRHVSLMLVDAYKTGRREISFSLDSPPQWLVDGQPFVPDTEMTRKMINRLKVMSKLNPMRYPDPVEGVILLKIEGQDVDVESRFTDTEDNQSCTLRLKNVVKKGSTHKTDIPSASWASNNNGKEQSMSRTYAGHCLSESEEYRGQRAPALLTIDPAENGFSCRFIFVNDKPTFVLVRHQLDSLNDSLEFEGASDDSRGWQVSWKIKVVGDHVSGSFDQPHDHGKIQLQRID